jgi:hypothetical protein
MSVPNGTKCISIVISKIAISNRDSSSMLLSDITPQFAAGYWDWRKGFWSSENAARLQKYNPKRRGAKTLGTANAKKMPALKTLQMEQSALNQIFYVRLNVGVHSKCLRCVLQTMAMRRVDVRVLTQDLSIRFWCATYAATGTALAGSQVKA